MRATLAVDELSTGKTKALCNAFINSQFYYAPFFWMFAGKLFNSRVQKIHFQSLQVVHNTYDTTYDELLSMSSHLNSSEALRFSR